MIQCWNKYHYAMPLPGRWPLSCVVSMLVAILLGLGAVLPASAETPEQTQFDFANGLLLRGYYEEAIVEYRQYVESYPNGEHVATAWLRLGESAFALEDYATALEAFDALAQRQALEGTDAQRLRLNRGEALFQLGRYGEARETLEPVTTLEGEPDLRARALYFAGRAAMESNTPTEAIPYFRTLIDTLSQHPVTPYARYHLAHVYTELEQFESAAIEFSHVADMASLDDALRAESRFSAAEIYDKIGWFGAAIGAYEQLRNDYPDSALTRRADYGYAWALYQDGRVEAAIDVAQAALERNGESPYTPGLYYLLANANQHLGQYESALAFFTRLQENHADSSFAARALHKMAWAYFQNGDADAARRSATAFLERNPESPFVPDTAFLLGSILVAEGNYESAYQEFRMVAEQFPDSTFGPDALYKSAECLGQLGSMGQAATLFSHFAESYPGHELAGQARLRAGDAHFRSQDYTAAREEYRKILDVESDPATEELAYYRLAVAQYNLQENEAAHATFRALLEKYPEGDYATEAAYRIGDYQLREARELPEAVARLQAVYDANPEGRFAGRALRDLALGHYELEAFDAAAARFLELIRRFPDISLNEETFAWVAQHHFDRDQWAEAKEIFEAMLSALPSYAYPERVRFLIAECNQHLGHVDEALTQYQQVIDTAPEAARSVEARFRMAQLLEQRGEHDQAFALYEAAANANSGDVAARARFRLGELYEARADYNNAARSFMQVAILFLHESLSPEALLRAGRSFEQENNRDQARRAYQELLSDFPDAEQAEAARQALSALDATQSPQEQEAG